MLPHRSSYAPISKKQETKIMNKTLTTLVVLATVASFAVASPNHAPTQGSKDYMKSDMKMMMMDMGMTNMFKGIEVNGGTANLYKKDGKFHLGFSMDFKTPGSPSPHWQVVDGNGNTFLLQRITIAGDKTNRDITLPSYIKSVKKVQVWCSFAEVVLGEATFSKAMKIN